MATFCERVDANLSEGWEPLLAIFVKGNERQVVIEASDIPRTLVELERLLIALRGHLPEPAPAPRPLHVARRPRQFSRR
jgi:hypothetical protein